MKPWAFTHMTALVLSLVSIEQNVMAASRCPLSNPAYADLRAAATALQQKITLGNGCESLENDLKAAGTSVKSAIDQIYKYEDDKKAREAAQAQDGAMATQAVTSNSDDLEARQKTLAAVDGIGTISNLINRFSGDPRNGCGRELMRHVDYMEALADTANGLSPYLLLYGGAGAAPLALGASIVGSLIKSFATFYHNDNFNMADAKVRQVFLENACSFYTFNENFEALQNRGPQIQASIKTIHDLEQDLASLQKLPLPPIPQGFEAYAQADDALKKDRKSLADILAAIQKFQDKDVASCLLVSAKVASGMGLTSQTYLNQFIEDTVAKPDPANPVDESIPKIMSQAFSDLSKPELYQRDPGTVPDKEHPLSCAVHAKSWLDTMQIVLDLLDQELSRDGRRNLAFKDRRTFQDRLNGKKVALQREQERLSWLEKLNDEGEAIDTSELFQVRDAVRDFLFQGETRVSWFGLARKHHSSPSESWLEEKNNQAEIRIKEFGSTIARIDSLWLKPSEENKLQFLNASVKSDACASVKTEYLTWFAARSHMRAVDSFCRVFRYSIADESYPAVAKYCFGRYDSKNKKYYNDGINAATSADVNARFKEAERLYRWLEKNECPMPPTLATPAQGPQS